MKAPMRHRSTVTNDRIHSRQQWPCDYESTPEAQERSGYENTREAQERSYKTGFIPVWKERGYDAHP